LVQKVIRESGRETGRFFFRHPERSEGSFLQIFLKTATAIFFMAEIAEQWAAE